jgi:hypothetical protein
MLIPSNELCFSSRSRDHIELRTAGKHNTRSLPRVTWPYCEQTEESFQADKVEQAYVRDTDLTRASHNGMKEEVKMEVWKEKEQ